MSIKKLLSGSKLHINARNFRNPLIFNWPS
jgi:hypothetical protein